MVSSSSKEESASDSENSSGDVPESSSKKCLFSEGERVLAYHGPRIYGAKVQKTEFRKNEWRYFVHYLGWNKNWDEWVGMDRLMKHTEENVLKQKALDKKAGVDKNAKSGRSAQAKPKNSADAKVDKDKDERKNTVAKGKKQKTDPSIEKDNPAAENLIKIQLPPVLKKKLVEDWEFVNQQNKLMKLPRSPTVDNILTEYLEYRSKKDGMMTDAVEEVLNGIRSYFDRALPTILLYKKERQQYRESNPDNVSPSSIYGAEHLLRLFVKLPELLTHVQIDEESLIRMQQRLVEFLKFLQKNENNYFLAVYEGNKVTEGGSKGKDKVMSDNN